MKRIKHVTSLAVASAAAASAFIAPASAHPGPHHGMSFTELAQHLATGWHLLMLAGAAIATTVALFIVAQRRQAKARSFSPKPGDRR